MPRNSNVARPSLNTRVSVTNGRQLQRTTWADLPVGTVGINTDPKTGKQHTMVKIFATKKNGGTRIVSLNDVGLVCSAGFSKNWSLYQYPEQVLGTLDSATITVA